MSSPTARSLAECRERGWRACKVEHHKTKFITVDAFGFGDILVLDGKRGSLLIQATTTDHVSHRLAKMRGECLEDVVAWLGAGNRVAVWGWAKRGKAGDRKLWTLKEVEVTSEVLGGQ